ncbi:MAG: YiiD C-terminal domain-containing protein [Chthoniobacterales bacterium]|nr:YiiD C-terminal domain-containing protein [Chthoniobacterales bacterium]
MKPDQRLRETEQFLHQQIPLTRAMQVRVESYGDGQLTVTAPLQPNHNHLGTAFGGSLAALVMLAGYAFLWLELGDREAHLVVSESTLRFRRPVRAIIRASCRQPNEATMAAFKAEFAATAKSRIRLSVVIEEEGQSAVEFAGTYVARRAPAAS